MSRNVIITIVVIIVVILGGWYLLRPKQPVVSTPSTESTVESTPAPAETAAPSAASEGAMMEKVVVKITKAGFSPKDITIKVGETVTWENDDTAAHTVNSAPHPTHTAYPSLNLGNVAPGAKVSLKFPTAGIYKYHDHLNPTLFGSVTVQ